MFTVDKCFSLYCQSKASKEKILWWNILWIKLSDAIVTNILWCWSTRKLTSLIQSFHHGNLLQEMYFSTFYEATDGMHTYFLCWTGTHLFITATYTYLQSVYANSSKQEPYFMSKNTTHVTCHGSNCLKFLFVVFKLHADIFHKWKTHAMGSSDNVVFYHQKSILYASALLERKMPNQAMWICVFKHTSVKSDFDIWDLILIILCDSVFLGLGCFVVFCFVFFFEL